MDLNLETFIDKNTYINGSWQAVKGKAWTLYNPATGKALLNTHLSTQAATDLAVQAAAKAFLTWRHTTHAQRADYLDKIASGIEARAALLVQLSVLNNGKRQLEAEIDVADAAACYRYYAELIRNQPEETKLSAPDGMTLLRRDLPIGVCALIVPWNFPMVTTSWKLAPALAAGCTAVLKPSEFTLLPELVLGDILTETGLPAGVVNIIAGDAEAGAVLSSHPLIDKISFTGSNRVGEIIMRQAATGTKNISLELGGKSAFIVCEDVDIDAACDWIMGGIFFNAGQICSATSRLLLPARIAEAVLQKLVEKTEKIRVGRGDDPAHDMGAITTAAQYQRILDYFQIAKAEGLTLRTGGHAVSENEGWFIAPTIYAPVSPQSRLWCEEIFGPVLVCAVYETEEEAIAIANDSDYGLVAAVASADTTRAKAIADQLRVGYVWINSEQIVLSNAGWGGFKQSGIGRELGTGGLAAYQASQHTLIPQ